MGLKRKMMEKMMPNEFGAISGLFHAGVFGLQANITDLVGDSGFKDYIFPPIKEAISNLENIGIEKVEGETLDEFGERFISVLKKSMLITNAEFKKKSDTEYFFSLENCFMARAAHQIAGKKGICPMAMVVTAMIEKYTGKTVNIGNSMLSSTGSETKITVY
ncbi:MAG: hypothetical protein ACFFG0_33445 [Candidatus Thorarchaeota archaeon]